MKLVNGALLILGLALAFLSTSYAQGVRSGSAGADNAEIEDASDFENEDEEEQGSFERFLAGKMTLRCPFPAEVKRKYNSGSACKEGGPLFKSWKRCKNYCYVCPCWDEKSYYDFNGNLIENPCTPTFCEPQNYDYQTPCSISSPKRRPNCCPCHPCKGIEILPPDHFLCTPRCTDGTPRGDPIRGYVCDGECTCEDKKCVSDMQGRSCSCRTPCELTKPPFCDGYCKEYGYCTPDSSGHSCQCKFDLSPHDDDILFPVDECEDTKPRLDESTDQLVCDGYCPGLCLPVGKERCMCWDDVKDPCEPMTPSINKQGIAVCDTKTGEMGGMCVPSLDQKSCVRWPVGVDGIDGPCREVQLGSSFTCAGYCFESGVVCSSVLIPNSGNKRRCGCPIPPLP